jgi:hypothetical protein
MGWKKDKKTIDLMQQKPPQPPKTTFMQEMEAIGKETVKIDSPEESEAKRKKDQKNANLLKEIEAATAKPEPEPVAITPVTPDPKETPMAEEKKQTAMAPVQHGGSNLDLVDYSPEEMSELQGTTGLEDIPESERRPPLVSWNLNMKDEHGKSILPHLFYNGQTGDQFEVLNCALVFTKKTYEFSHYDKTTKKKTTYCRSWDRQTGTFMEDVPTDKPDIANKGGKINDIRRCENCPYRQGKKGERKSCTIVYRNLAWDLDRQIFFIFNAQRSSFVPFNRHLEANFFGQWKMDNGKRRDIPLFLLHSRFTLVQEENYFVIKPEIATDVYPKGILPKVLVKDLAVTSSESAKIRRQDLEVDDKNAQYQSSDASEPIKGELLNEDGTPSNDDDTPF